MLRHRLTLGLALGTGLFTSIFAYNAMNDGAIEKTVSQTMHEYNFQSVAVASTALPWGTVFAEEMVKVVDYPDGSVPSGAFAAYDSLKGRVLLSSLQPNEPILESKLAPESMETGGVSAILHPEKRAMAVKVNEAVGVGGFIKPGDKVDVMVTIDRGGEKKKKIITKIVLENILVLASGIHMERQGKEEEAVPVKYITLEVTPKEAEKLALAINEGNIRFALRSPLNSDPILTKGETVPSLLDSYRSKRTPRTYKPQRKQRVEILKGVELSTVTVVKM